MIYYKINCFILMNLSFLPVCTTDMNLKISKNSYNLSKTHKHFITNNQQCYQGILDNLKLYKQDHFLLHFFQILGAVNQGN